MPNYKYIAERKNLIGKKIQWGEHYDPHRGNYLLREGVVEAVEGKNFLIDNDWQWYPDMKGIKIIEE